MYIARKNASTTDERSKAIDSQDPFALSEVPVAGAIINPLVGSATRQAADSTVAQLNTTTVAYGAFGGNDLTDHYKFTGKKDITYALVVTTDSSNGNIRTEAYADYFDIYFEDANGVRVTADFQIKELDLFTKLVEYKVPADGTYYIQIDNAFEQPFEYAVALIDKSIAPTIAVTSKDNGAGGFLLTFTADMVLSTTRPRVDRIEVAGGTLGTLTRSADGKAYTATFTPSAAAAGTAPVEPSVKVLTGAFFSRAGDFNLDGGEANNAAVLKPAVPPPVNPPTDTIKPTVVSIAVPDADQAPGATPTITITFSEAVKDFTRDDLDISGGELREFSGSGTVYTAKVSVLPGNTDGVVTVSVRPDGYTDLAGNKGTGLTSSPVRFDLVAPEAVVSLADGRTALGPGESAELTLVFSEPVRAFDAGAVVVTGGTVDQLRALGTDGRAFALVLSADSGATATGPITIKLDESKITDRVGNRLKAFDGPRLSIERAAEASGLEVIQTASVDAADSLRFGFELRHGSSAKELTAYLDDGLGPVAVLGSGRASELKSVVFTAQPEVLTAELMVTDAAVEPGQALSLAPGQSAFSLGLVVTLGTDSVAGMEGSGADSLSVVSDLPTALYGFGGDDVLIEGDSTVVMNGGDGVDSFELTPSLGATLVEDTGSPVSLDLLFSVGGLFPAYFGFDLITGFDISVDTFRFTGRSFAEHQTVIGVYDANFGTFSVDALGADVMVFLDNDGGTVGELDEGENAVVIVGGASAVNTPAIGGNGE